MQQYRYGHRNQKQQRSVVLGRERHYQRCGRRRQRCHQRSSHLQGRCCPTVLATRCRCRRCCYHRHRPPLLGRCRPHADVTGKTLRTKKRVIMHYTAAAARPLRAASRTKAAATIKAPGGEGGAASWREDSFVTPKPQLDAHPNTYLMSNDAICVCVRMNGDRRPGR